MKNKPFLTTASLLVGVTVALAEPPKMKMTTEVPEGLATPDKLETSLGTITSFDGVPDKESTQKIYDNLDLQRATQAFLKVDRPCGWLYLRPCFTPRKALFAPVQAGGNDAVITLDGM